jgi:hypothetical protein
LGERRTVQVVNGVDNSTDSENTNLDKKAIHIHGGIEHNLAEYAKYYFCGCTKVLGSCEFTRETNRSGKDFSRH